MKDEKRFSDCSASVLLAVSGASPRKNACLTFNLKFVITLFRASALKASGTLALQSFMTTRLFLKYVFILSYCLFLFSLPPSAAAHRFHTTLTRIDYNPDEKLYEISIKIFTHDLVPLLERRSGGRKVDLEKTPGVDRMIQDYLNENFVLTDKKGETKQLKWIGKEVEIDSIQIFVETPATENLEGFKLSNTLFFESFPEQSNLVVCRYDGRKAGLMFKVGDKTKEIMENKAAEK